MRISLAAKERFRLQHSFHKDRCHCSFDDERFLPAQPKSNYEHTKILTGSCTARKPLIQRTNAGGSHTVEFAIKLYTVCWGVLIWPIVIKWAWNLIPRSGSSKKTVSSDTIHIKHLTDVNLVSLVAAMMGIDYDAPEKQQPIFLFRALVVDGVLWSFSLYCC